MADDSDATQDQPAALQITPQDRDIAIRTMIGEENSPDGMAGVGSVMLNRAATGAYGGNSLAGVALAPGQFNSWSNPQRLLAISPNSPAYQQAGKIFDGLVAGQIPDLTSGSTNFYAPKLQAANGAPPPAWAKGTPVSLGSSLFYAPNGRTSYKAPAAQAISAATSGAPQADFETDFPVAPPSQGSFETDFPVAPAKGATAASPTPLPPGIPNKPGVYALPGNPPPPSSVAASAPADFETDFPVAPRGAAPQASQPAQPAPQSSVGSTVNNVERAIATGIPIVGGLANKGDAALNAFIAPAFNRFYAPQDQLQGATYGERYNNALAQQNGMDQSFAAAHPVANNLLATSGAVLGTLPGMIYAPGAFGVGVSDIGAGAAASAGTGSVIGGADSAVRSDGNWNAIGRGAGEGFLFGGLGPLAAGAIGSGIGRVSNLLSGTNPAARNVANIFSAIGMTPEDAQAALTRMGPNATLADIDPSLATEGGALASLGGQPTSILKNAMAARAAGANERVGNAVDQNLGARPDLTATQDAIRQKASTDASPFYNAARASGGSMDVVPVLSYIDNKLASSVGGVADTLKTAKGYLTKEVTSLPGADGNSVKAIVPKDDPQSLLSARQALDDYIERRGGADLTAGKNALREASTVRAQLDSVLKQDPNIAAGDKAYAAHMRNLDALDEGTSLFKPGTRIEDVRRSLQSKSPAEVAAMRQGALSAIHDATDNARQGDFAAARSLFAKSTANRAKLDALFPNSGKLFDALEGETAMRATEHTVAANSLTAERTAAQQRYRPTAQQGQSPTAAIVGNALDGGMGAVAMTGARAAYGALKNAFTEAGQRRLEEGMARGLSSTGAEQSNFMGQVERAAKSNRVTNLLSNAGKFGTRVRTHKKVGMTG